MDTPFRSFTDVRPEVRAFESYEPGLSIAEIARRYGLSNVIKMASNENPLGVSPAARRTIEEKASLAFRYPQSGNPRLVRALASHYSVSPSRIFIGNGSDEIIDLLFRVRAMPGVHSAAAFDPCFGLYTTQARMSGVELRRAPLGRDCAFDFAGLRSVIDGSTTLVFVTSPDNPSGRVAPPAELAALAADLPPACILVVDEAYMEFADEGDSITGMLDRLPNVAVMRTFSKLYGLAGLRIGYAILPEAIADYLWRVRLPFSLNLLGEEAALAALGDDAFRRQSIALVRQERAYLSTELAALGCRVIPSRSNFIMFRPSPAMPEAADIHTALLSRGIIIRPLRAYGMPAWLRVSVGTHEENVRFLQALRSPA